MKVNRPKFVMRCMRFGNETFIGDPAKMGVEIDLRPVITDRKQEARVFDDRDNLTMKARFFKATTGLDFQAVSI